MSFFDSNTFRTSPEHNRHHHAKKHHQPNNRHHHNWEASNSYHYTTTTTTGSEYQYFLDPPRKHQHVEYVRSPVSVAMQNLEVCNENVDAVAEEFIKLEHKKFEQERLMSMNGVYE
ncbi:hypothetical protein Tsubulata_044960 [Turnera subulata]|uniref:Uncharacterized protein n=1 Tax=Turnera subulata TaxID=218843 RepID=A0A9Q0GB12_9ROSI|nr:hypothetical protein Tsubulata_044960 [Turnera subulata]